MRFLSLTALQAGILALVTTGVVVALYFLKLRHRRVFVSSSLLWHRVLEDKKSHSLMEKLRRIMSIIVAVTIALLIALSLARPEIEALTGKNERIVIVLDTSPTMATVSTDGRTRWEHAVAEAQSLLNSGGPTTEFRISDTSGRIASSFTTDRNEIRLVLEKMRPVAAEPQFPKVDATDSLVYFISDGVAIPLAPKTAKRISVFEKAQNVGITAFELRAKPSVPPAYEAYIEVQNFGAEAAAVEIVISGAGGQRINKSGTLAPDGSTEEVVDLTSFEGGPIRATVQAKGDSLPTDDVAFAYLPIKRRTRTMLVTTGNRYLETLLKLDPFVELAIVPPAAYKEADVDAYIFDRFAPATPPARPALVIGAPDVPWLRPPQGTVTKPQIVTWDDAHPIMQFVSVHDMSIEHAARIDAAGLSVIAASAQTPLIVASDRPRFVLLTFDLQSTDFPLHIGFPVFIDNVLAWFSRDQLALRVEPGTVEIPLSNAQVRSIDDKVVPSQTQLNKTVFEAPGPGLYTATSADSRVHIAVNLASRTFSDVNRSAFKNDAAPVSEQRLLRRELWYYMLLAAVLLIGAEWFTYHKRLTL